ncbi:type IV secretion system protein [Hydrogenophaga sp. RWCD_12]|uniref:type IV secretion system protein n=1 Tax=Hydrogenophaga sp. RWCD_12 TaxID=3391190 RepID=UPI003984D8B4
MATLLDEPTCAGLHLADFLGQMVVVPGFSEALENSGVFPARYLNALSDAAFYCDIRKYVLYETLTNKWMWFVVNNLSIVVLSMSTAFVTLWIVTTGLKVMFRTNKEPVLDLMFRGAKIALVLSLVTGMLGKSDTIIHTVLGIQESITTIVTGSDLSVDQLIDMNVGVTQVVNMVSEDVTNTTIDQANKSGGSSVIMSMLGGAGPAVLTSVLVLLSQVAVVLALMLAPLFVFFLLFQQTSALFWSWAKFLLGTFITLCFVGIVSTIAMQATLSYGMTIMVSYVLNSVADAGIADNATAVQTGLGVIAEVLIGLLTNGGNRVDMGGATMRLAMMGGLFATLIVAVPPVIMQLFNTSLGFAQNVMGSIGVRPLQPASAGGGAGAASGGGGGTEHFRVGAATGALPGYAPMQKLAAGGHESGPAGGMAQSNVQQAITRANTMGASGGDAAAAMQGGGGTFAGAKGLANQENASVKQIRAQQASEAFRVGSNMPASSADASKVAAIPTELGGTKWQTNGTNVTDAVIKSDSKLGTGGHLVIGDHTGSVGGAQALGSGAANAGSSGSASAGGNSHMALPASSGDKALRFARPGLPSRIPKAPQ